MAGIGKAHSISVVTSIKPAFRFWHILKRKLWWHGATANYLNSSDSQSNWIESQAGHFSHSTGFSVPEAWVPNQIFLIPVFSLDKASFPSLEVCHHVPNMSSYPFYLWDLLLRLSGLKKMGSIDERSKKSYKKLSFALNFWDKYAFKDVKVDSLNKISLVYISSHCLNSSESSNAWRITFVGIIYGRPSPAETSYYYNTRKEKNLSLGSCRNPSAVLTSYTWTTVNFITLSLQLRHEPQLCLS